MTLTEFLLARIDEDEAAARAASPAPWSYPGIESVAGGLLYDASRTIAQIVWDNPGDHDGSIVRFLPWDESDANGAHIARHDPARVLAECEAKRRIVEKYDHARDCGQAPGGWLEECVAYLAAVYADHPDYDEAWRV